MQKSRVRL